MGIFSKKQEEKKEAGDSTVLNSEIKMTEEAAPVVSKTKKAGDKAAMKTVVMDPVKLEAIKNEMKSMAHGILIRPLVTEKMVNLAGKNNQYAFAVDKKANKITVAKIVSALYGVKVEAVNTITMKGKVIRYGKTTGKTKTWKKALVTLRKGDKIDVFAGV